MFLIVAIGTPSAAQKVGYVYCVSPENPVSLTPEYSSPPISIPLGSLKCGEKVQVLGREESWLRIASADGERYVSMATISQRKDRFVVFHLPLPPEPRPQYRGKVIPRVTYSPNAEYTQNAMKAKVHGFVILKLTVGTDGRAHDVRVVQGLGYGLDESATQAVQSWKFEPALEDNVPIEFKTAVEVELPPRQ